MKKYIIFIFALTLLPMSIGAEITLRKGSKNTKIRTQQRVQPTNNNDFDAIYTFQPESKQNISYQKNAYKRPQKQVAKGYNVSYFSAGTQVETSTKLHINSNQGVKCYRYDAPEVASNDIGLETTYKMPTLQPFNDEVKEVKTGSIQYAYGPPTEGPIGDFIFPLLTLACLYIALKKKN